MPPSYNSRNYWNQRFSNEDTFDWLLPTCRSTSIVAEQIQHLHNSDRANILHVGCGNSELSHRIPDVVDANTSITNADFSETVIEAAKAKAEYAHQTTSTNCVKWVSVDLLSIEDIVTKLLASHHAAKRADFEAYDLVIDKGTTDSISCGEDIPVTLPYPVAKDTIPQQKELETTQAAIHPIHILALHLALLCPRPGSRWLVFSYSEHRFPFLDPSRTNSTLYGDLADGSLARDVLEAGFPDTSKLWRLQSKWSVETANGQDGCGSVEDGRMVHRPPELCWVYVLVRTGLDVRLSDVQGEPEMAECERPAA